MILFYGPEGVGKSVSVLLSAPDPICMIQAENRGLEPTMEVVRSLRPNLDLDIAYYENFNDTMEYINRGDLSRYKTIMGDSLTDLMAVKLPIEIRDEAWEAKAEKEKKEKVLISQSKLTKEDYGGIGDWTIRLTNALAYHAREGKYVILLARLDHNPSWGLSYEYAPTLKGKEYGKHFGGMFDLIGIVSSRTKEVNGEQVIVYPPRVNFESGGNFMAKWTGIGDKKSGPLDLSKILKVEVVSKEEEKKEVEDEPKV
jgi:hypothetical protein